MFDLRTLCVGEPNSKEGKFYRTLEPRVGGVAVDVRSGRVVAPAKFNRGFVKEEDGGKLVKTKIISILVWEK